MFLVNLNCRGIRNCKLNLLTFAESGTITYIRSLRIPRQNHCADKFYVTGIREEQIAKTCVCRLSFCYELLPLTNCRLFRIHEFLPQGK